MSSKVLWRREWVPTPVFWPGEFHGLYSPWGCKESDITERLSLSYYISSSLSEGLFSWCPRTHRAQLKCRSSFSSLTCLARLENQSLKSGSPRFLSFLHDPQPSSNSGVVPSQWHLRPTSFLSVSLASAPLHPKVSQLFVLFLYNLRPPPNSRPQYPSYPHQRNLSKTRIWFWQSSVLKSPKCPSGERIHPRARLLNFQIFLKIPVTPCLRSHIIHHKLLRLVCTCYILSHLYAFPSVGSLTSKPIPSGSAWGISIHQLYCHLSKGIPQLPSFFSFLCGHTVSDKLSNPVFLLSSAANQPLSLAKHSGFKQPPFSYWS